MMPPRGLILVLLSAVAGAAASFSCVQDPDSASLRCTCDPGASLASPEQGRDFRVAQVLSRILNPFLSVPRSSFRLLHEDFTSFSFDKYCFHNVFQLYQDRGPNSK